MASFTHLRRGLPAVALTLAVLATGCGTSVSTSSFKGEQHAVAQRIADLQSDATAGDQGKVCTRDLSSALVRRLGGRKGCEAALKEQLAEIDNLETSVRSVTIAPDGRTARATVKSIYSGKTRPGTVQLVREGGSWRVSGLQ
jgi:hypothetical protein